MGARMRARAIIAVLLGIAGVCALAIGVLFVVAAQQHVFLAQAILLAIGSLAMGAALAFALVAYFALRGGVLGQVLAALVAVYALLELVPYLVAIVRRGDDVTWIVPIAAVTLLFATVLGAAGYGLARHALASRRGG